MRGRRLLQFWRCCLCYDRDLFSPRPGLALSRSIAGQALSIVESAVNIGRSVGKQTGLCARETGR